MMLMIAVATKFWWHETKKVVSNRNYKDLVGHVLICFDDFDSSQVLRAFSNILFQIFFRGFGMKKLNRAQVKKS